MIQTPPSSRRSIADLGGDEQCERQRPRLDQQRRQLGDHRVEIEILVTQRDIEFVENDHRNARIGHKLQRLGPGALGRGDTGHAGAHARQQAGPAVLFLVPVIHPGEQRITLVYRNDRPIGEHLEVFVGYDRRDFQDNV